MTNTSTKPETGIYMDSATGAAFHAEDVVREAGGSAGAALDAGIAARQAYLDWRAAANDAYAAARDAHVAAYDAYIAEMVASVGDVTAR